MLKQKTIHGFEVPHEVFKRTILEFADYPEGRSTLEIAWHLGAEYDGGEPRSLLHSTLLTLTKSKLLFKPKRDRYQTNPRYKVDGLSAGDNYKNTLLNFIRNNGGVCRRAEIMWGLCQSDHPEPYDHRPSSKHRSEKDKVFFDTRSKLMYGSAACAGISRAIQSLVESGQLRRDYARDLMFGGPRRDGWYNLPGPELNTVIIPPRKFFHMYEMGYDPNRPVNYLIERVSKGDAAEAMDAHLRNLGRGMRLARKSRGRSVEWLLTQPEVVSSMRWFADECIVDIGRLRSHDLKDWKSAPTDLEINCKLWDAMEEYEDRLTGFCSRRPSLALRIEVITAVAKVLEVDPVGLARGQVFSTQPVDLKYEDTTWEDALMDELDDDPEEDFG